MLKVTELSMTNWLNHIGGEMHKEKNPRTYPHSTLTMDEMGSAEEKERRREEGGRQEAVQERRGRQEAVQEY